MRPRSYALALLACFIAVVALQHFRSAGDPQEGKVIQPLSKTQETTDQSDPGIPSSSSPVVTATKTGETPVEQPKPATSEAQNASWIQRTAARFAHTADPDPQLSRELEQVVQLASRYALETNRYELQSMKCRGNTCQMAIVDNKPNVDQPVASTIGRLLAEMEKGSARNPTTGETLQPTLQGFELYPANPVGALMLVSFDTGKR
jgi:hypothetical protein